MAGHSQKCEPSKHILFSLKFDKIDFFSLMGLISVLFLFFVLLLLFGLYVCQSRGGQGITLTLVSQICFSLQQVRYTQCQSWIYSKKGENASYLFAHITLSICNHFSKHHQNSWCSFPWLPLGCMEPLLM